MIDDLRPLVARFADAIAVTEGRRAGDPETRIQLDHRVPTPGRDGAAVRWRLMTSNRRLYPPPVSRESLSIWHAADGIKGRRLVAFDLTAQHRVAAILSWHFDPGKRSRRPHLVTAAAVASTDAATATRAEDLVALQMLFCVALAIDSKTVDRHTIGLVADNAIDLSAAELAQLGFVRGPRRGGYRGDYRVLRLSRR